MRIAIIGGMDRNQAALTRLATQYGHSLECHAGDVGGRKTETLRAIVERSDLLVLVIGVNSHSAVQLGKRFARRLGKASVILRNCGVARLQTLLDALAIAKGRENSQAA